MENSGWIYLRVDDGRAYCFGKTDSPSRRDSEYRKENPWIKKVYDFFVEDMHAVEAELAERTKSHRVLENSKEWIRLCEEAREIVDEVREQYGLMTYAEWERLKTEKEAASQLRANLEHQRTQEDLQLQLGQAERLRQQEEAELRAKEYRLLRELQENRSNEIRRQEMWRQELRHRMPLLHRTCPTCQMALSYNAASTGYRCAKCGKCWN